MGNEVPEDPNEFNELMVRVDRELSESGFSIPQRPVNALGIVSKMYHVPLPITKPMSGFQHESVQFWPISARVYQWYDHRYGERTKMDFSPGRMVILIEDDLWILRFPRVFGSVALTVSRTIQSDKIRSDGRPATYNVVDAIQDMPTSRLAVLPDNELEYIYEKFMLGFRALSIFEGSKQNSLINAAVGDVSAAVDHLMASIPQYGQSKWSSLQAAEKTLKAAISLSKGSYSNIHDLSKLSMQAHSAGITGDWSDLTDAIQCTAAIRYGDESCSRDEAVLAHHAALGLVITLADYGAKFMSETVLHSTR